MVCTVLLEVGERSVGASFVLSNCLITACCDCV